MFTEITNRALLKITGTDAKSFLQNQLTNDINAATDSNIQINAYCQHQGRIISLFWLMKKDDDFYLSCPRDIISVALQRLQMFVLMAQVKISDVSDDFIQIGVIDDYFKAAYKLNKNQAVVLINPAEIDNFNLSGEHLWHKACIENGVAEVYLATTEKFIPQMLNLDIDEAGVSFSKGCYPGQEVVARLHYLATAKRRMMLFSATQDIAIGKQLVSKEQKSTKVVGFVVRNVKLAQHSLCLATINVASQDDEIFLDDIYKIKLIRKIDE